ncbi:MAG: hypothetical protein HF982_08220 [Desulfobacteraceae bacterium]|nr:hypothetical protein [Desulfobacteraceae bacterium]MBC2719554.1 hypothetical protein [Desulfobacteraceae bacterium]
MTKSENKEMWKQKISAYKKSGLSAVKWCEANEEKIHTLRYWINKINKESKENSSETKWVSIQSSTIVDNYSFKVTVGKALVEIPESFNRAAFEDIVSILSKQC